MIVNHYADWRTQIRQFRLIHGGTVKDYQDVAAAFNLKLCSEIGGMHRRGQAERPNTIHWSLRRVNRHGLRRFLKLAARLRVLNYESMSRAEKIYAENMWALRAAAALHIRFPHSYSEMDRLAILWLASQGDPVSERALRWAKRPRERKTTNV